MPVSSTRGFVPKTEAEYLADFRAQFETYGWAAVDENPDWIHAQLMARHLAVINEDMEEVYKSGFLVRSRGAQLDLHLQYIDEERREALPSTIECLITGTGAGTIAVADLTLTAANGETFVPEAAITVPASLTTSARFVAETGGAAGNIQPNTITSYQDIAGLVGSLSNPSTTESQVTRYLGNAGSNSLSTISIPAGAQSVYYQEFVPSDLTHPLHVDAIGDLEVKNETAQTHTYKASVHLIRSSNGAALHSTGALEFTLAAGASTTLSFPGQRADIKGVPLVKLAVINSVLSTGPLSVYVDGEKPYAGGSFWANGVDQQGDLVVSLTTQVDGQGRNGRDREDDPTALERYDDELALGGSAHPMAIESRIRALDGVRRIYADFNADTSPDRDGIPKGGVRISVDGDFNRLALAQAVWSELAGGTDMVGNLEIPFTDDNERLQTVTVQTVERKLVYVRTTSSVSELFNGTDDVNELKDGIINYLGGLMINTPIEALGLKIGDPVIYEHLIHSALDFEDGKRKFTNPLFELSWDGVTWVQTDLTDIDNTQRAYASEQSITVLNTNGQVLG